MENVMDKEMKYFFFERKWIGFNYLKGEVILFIINVIEIEYFWSNYF